MGNTELAEAISEQTSGTVKASETMLWAFTDIVADALNMDSQPSLAPKMDGHILAKYTLKGLYLHEKASK